MWTLFLLLYLSVSTRGVIGQFRGPYFTVQPAKLQLVSFPAGLINLSKYLTNLIFSVRTVSNGSSFFPVDLWPASINQWEKTSSVTYSTDLELG